MKSLRWYVARVGKDGRRLPRSCWVHRAASVAGIAALAGCGADSVDVGDRLDTVSSAGTDNASELDAGTSGGGQGSGGQGGGGGSACSIPNLGQYRLLFDSDGSQLERRIYSMRADGTEVEPLTPPEELAREPALSPDGSQLAYTTPEGIRLRDMASGQSELVVPMAELPAWSPDGGRLIYRKIGPGNCFEQMRLPERIVADGDVLLCDGYATSMDLTPDGSTLVYVYTTPDEGIRFKYSVFSWMSGGFTAEIVPAGANAIARPTVSPDGIWLAAEYECAGSGASSLWASPLSVRTPACEGRRITPAGGPSAKKPQWGPGTLIAYERGEPPRDLAVIAADTGEECVIAGPGDDRNPSWGIVPLDEPE